MSNGTIEKVLKDRPQRLSGKVAVVTGASKGIGAEIARRLTAEGASVVVNYAGDREGADKVSADIAAAGGKATVVQGNVAKAEDVERIFSAAAINYERSTSSSTMRASTSSARSRRSPKASTAVTSIPTFSASCSRQKRRCRSSVRRAAASSISAR